ncbi:basic membrane protein A [Alkalibacterium putridalgicola]|uniref:BMP family ABC transporter substrate-binding protein n=2 Tax=Alkalibacterium putridalgicola TaxID=426703 RepID=A0A1H7SFK5_9LACT|nr:BMP family ABC transporter substrate-binding protein [Alkalibacterium putridalgicola]SEL71099.1 basic membrane protein A [Alkalibacterium putridalgicola]
MSKMKLRSLLAIGSSAFLLAACQGEDASDPAEDPATEEETGTDSGEEAGEETEAVDFSIGMVTDEGGVDDRSFNQSAWEGMQEWGQNNGLEEGDGYAYYQSDDSADFVPNLNQALTDGYDIIYGIGYLLLDSVNQVADQNPDQHFGIVDDISDRDNVVSLTFADHQAAFLAGVAAAETTETGKVGFIGGIAGPVIDRFETGFTAGVAHADDSVEVDVQYAESFGDAGIGQQIAAGMFSNGADVIYHAAGAVGNGVFTEARNRMESDPDNQLWVIGVDRDQEEEGEYDGGNLTLTSTLKRVGTAIQESANQAMEEGFPGGETIAYGLEEGGVDLVEGNLSEEAWTAVEEARQAVIDGEVEVPEFSYSQE